MKKVFFIAATCLLAGLANAQQLKSDGTITDSHNSTLGYLKSDGTVEDSHHSTIGYIKKDGTIEDSHHSTIGYLKSDGTIENRSHSTLKKAGSNRMEDVLKQFFFK